MWRAIWYLPAAALWTAITLVPGFLLGALTLGRFSDRLINVFAPVWGRGFLYILGIDLEVIGKEHIAARRSRVIVMNHTSTLDMLAVAAISPPGLLALGKKEFAWIPVLGQAWWALGQAFVDRGNKIRAQRSIAKIADIIRRTPRSVVVFPEGTRSRDGKLQAFKKGAFHLVREARVPLVPMVMYGAYERVRPDSMWVMPGRITVVIHPERSTADWDDRNLVERARELQQDYVKWLIEGPPA
jgi:putative phosphoserine phosphatase/1-acylglycerol-3-phosphate O-acyltransferase